jgi:hypothetical protein
VFLLWDVRFAEWLSLRLRFPRRNRNRERGTFAQVVVQTDRFRELEEYRVVRSL